MDQYHAGQWSHFGPGLTVDGDADLGRFRDCLQVRPAGGFGHPEDVLGQIFLGVLGVRELLLQEFGPLEFKGSRNVAQEEEAQRDVLVLAGVHRAAHLVGRVKEGFFDFHAWSPSISNCCRRVSRSGGQGSTKG
jgi:hypothetical protein